MRRRKRGVGPTARRRGATWTASREMFGQVVVGPPGAGKTTYCEGMRQFLESVGRKVVVINLDPANDTLPYPVAVDVRDLISLEGAARACELGPNGALVYCIEYLAANLDWLLDRLAPHADAYALFDMPGQVELYSHHGAVRTILHGLQQQQHRVCAVHLVDAHHCADPAKFISVLLVTLSAMVQLEVPQVNLLSKIDLIESYGELAFNLDFYTDLPEPARLLPYLEECEGGGAFARKHVALSAAICELVRAHPSRRPASQRRTLYPPWPRPRDAARRRSTTSRWCATARWTSRRARASRVRSARSTRPTATSSEGRPAPTAACSAARRANRSGTTSGSDRSRSGT